LGYVGLPLAVTFAKKGFKTTGFDVSEKRVLRIKNKENYIHDVKDKDLKTVVEKKFLNATTDFSFLKNTDAIIICVPTPLQGKNPDMSFINASVEHVKDNLRKGHIIILESTTYPGTTKEVLLPPLEKTGLKEGKDFFLAFSPERVDPGNEKFKTENTPKVVGGVSFVSTVVAKTLYEQVIETVIPVRSSGEAEMVKILENTFRIVNIALVNELTELCERMELNIWDIVDAAKTKPYGFMPFYPGPGVGGHCIPIDPLYLAWKAKTIGLDTKFIQLASHVNHHMPSYVIKRLDKLLTKKKKHPKILIIGVSYKKDVRDLRETPVVEIIEQLQKQGKQVDYYDPLFHYFKINNIDLKCSAIDKKSLAKYDAAILVTDHTKLPYKAFADGLKLIFDTRNAFANRGIVRDNIKVL
ncbi:MAG: nucleotide sugar dehydrogenase, partial [Candidatus Omnitrophica bacterium]|nr:nucleotide sugar dehydrogenase [Candidatus Omnitrophota bacterium]